MAVLNDGAAAKTPRPDFDRIASPTFSWPLQASGALCQTMLSANVFGFAVTFPLLPSSELQPQVYSIEPLAKVHGSMGNIIMLHAIFRLGLIVDELSIFYQGRHSSGAGLRSLIIRDTGFFQYIKEHLIGTRS